MPTIIFSKAMMHNFCIDVWIFNVHVCILAKNKVNIDVYLIKAMPPSSVGFYSYHSCY